MSSFSVYFPLCTDVSQSRRATITRIHWCWSGFSSNATYAVNSTLRRKLLPQQLTV